MATNLVGSVHYPRSKVVFGDPGSATDVSLANPLPVEVSGVAAVASGFVTLAEGITGNVLDVIAGANGAVLFLLVGGDADGIFQLMIGGVSFGLFRISYMNRTIPVPLGAIPVVAGQHITVTAQCISQSGSSGDYEAYVYYR